MTTAESDALMRKRHPKLFDGLTTDQLMDKLLQDVQAMTSDEKAHLRAKLNKSVGIAPKSSGGKPS